MNIPLTPVCPGCLHHTNVECPKCGCWCWGYIGEECRSEGCDGIMCKKALTSNLWIPFGERQPPRDCPRLLVTNNIRARDSFGHTCHVWLVHMVHRQDNGSFAAFDDHHVKIYGLTHWRFAVPEDSPVETKAPPTRGFEFDDGSSFTLTGFAGGGSPGGMFSEATCEESAPDGTVTVYDYRLYKSYSPARSLVEEANTLGRQHPSKVHDTGSNPVGQANSAQETTASEMPTETCACGTDMPGVHSPDLCTMRVTPAMRVTRAHETSAVAPHEDKADLLSMAALVARIGRDQAYSVPADLLKRASAVLNALADSRQTRRHSVQETSEKCPYGVYATKCTTHPECPCGRHDKHAAEQRASTARDHLAEGFCWCGSTHEQSQIGKGNGT